MRRTFYVISDGKVIYGPGIGGAAWNAAMIEKEGGAKEVKIYRRHNGKTIEKRLAGITDTWETVEDPEVINKLDNADANNATHRLD